jgi:diadenosine tetraphosphate (Ap4A) HIT family hydrolase
MGSKHTPVSLRSEKDEEDYIKKKKNGRTKALIDEPRIKEWHYWALINNAYPYNLAYKTHHMLIPKREASQEELSEQEKAELELILNELSGDYDCRLINFRRKQSVLHHFHIHLLVYKDCRKDMQL